MFDFGVRVATVVGSSYSCSCSGMLTSNEKWDPALLVLARPVARPLALPPFGFPPCRFCHAVGGRDEREPEEEEVDKVLDARGWWLCVSRCLWGREEDDHSPLVV
jgi:hypothetical protein